MGCRVLLDVILATGGRGLLGVERLLGLLDILSRLVCLLLSAVSSSGLSSGRLIEGADVLIVS